MDTTNRPTVKAGRIIADCDPRVAGRTLSVEAIEDRGPGLRGDTRVAVCKVLTPPDAYPDDRTGQTTRIRVDRIHGADWTGRSGFRLIQDAPTE